MFLRKLEDYDLSKPGKINRIKISKIMFFAVLIVMGIVFSSLTETESATIFNSSTSSFSAENSRGGEQLTINSK